MVAALLKSGVLLATLGSMAVSGGGQDQASPYPPSVPVATAPAPLVPQSPAASAALSAAIAQWKAVQQTDALPFGTYATFLLAHPGWPGAAHIRRAAEQKGDDGTAPATIVTFFNRYPPQTASGGLYYALALLATGQRAQAETAARGAWRMGALSTADEATMVANFGAVLTPDDHDARMDALLWQGQTAAAQRQLAFVSPARREVYTARLAFRTKAPEAFQISTATMDRYAGDAGYIADRAEWMRNTNAWLTARTWLARTRTLTAPPANVGRWYAVLLANARAAAADGQWQTAYDIARQVDDAYPAGTDVSQRPYDERDTYTDLVWLAGQMALTRLNRPADAMVLFERYAGGSQNPGIRAKGLYWAGRAAEAAGQQAAATGYFGRAAAFPDVFYGQLATEHLGRALTAPHPLPPMAVAPETRSAFYNREVVRAAQLLGQIADWQDQTAFVRQIALDAKTDADHALGDELSRSLNRPDLGVMIGRSALQNGLSDYSLVGYPTVPVPLNQNANWTIIHAIARQESQFDRAAISGAGARGLMQLMPGTAREAASQIGLSYDNAALTTDPSYNIQLGSSYFQRIFNLYGSYPLAIAAYNAGPGNVNKWLAANGDPRSGSVDVVAWVEAIPFSETKYYVQHVLENAVVYDLISPQHARSHGPANLSWYLGKGKPG